MVGLPVTSGLGLGQRLRGATAVLCVGLYLLLGGSFYSNNFATAAGALEEVHALMIAILVLPLCIMEVAFIIGFNCNWIRP